MNDEMSLKIVSPTDLSVYDHPIIINYEELYSYLNEKLDRYRSVIYDDDQMAVAKEDRARLNKLVKQFSDELRRIKGICLAPFSALEKKIKSLNSLIQEPIGLIDSQVKTFEQKCRENKMSRILGVYKSIIGELEEFVPYEVLHNDRWLNKTVAMATVTEELSARVERVKNELVTIEALKSEDETSLKAYYFRKINFANPSNSALSDALQENERMKRQRRAIEEAKLRHQLGEREEIAPQPVATSIKPVEPIEVPAESLSEETTTVAFRCSLTRKQAILLKDFFTENGIEYQQIKN